MIFCLYGAFLENSLSKQNFPSPHMLAVCMQGEGGSLSFFLRLAALCMVLLRRFKILLGWWIGGMLFLGICIVTVFLKRLRFVKALKNEKAALKVKRVFLV